jgi:hypothetical protein
MKPIVGAGILAGMYMMPILPGSYDTDEILEQVTHGTTEPSGKLELAGGLTLATHQQEIDQR